MSIYAQIEAAKAARLAQNPEATAKHFCHASNVISEMAVI